jgi:hypothetical protein
MAIDALLRQGSSFDKLRTSGACSLMVSLSNHEQGSSRLAEFTAILPAMGARITG